MQVLKFGGTSVASPNAIQQVRSIIESKNLPGQTVIVVSAFGGVTESLLKTLALAREGNEKYKNQLSEIRQRHLDCIKELLPLNSQSSVLSQVMQQFHILEDTCTGIALLNELSDRSSDRVLAYGELLSSQIISAYFQSAGLKHLWKDARELILTDDHFSKATVLEKETRERIRNCFLNSEENLFVVPGFIAEDSMGQTTTLGRGGSDYTAAIIGAALDADLVEIWTDVSGMMTADPRLVANARVIPSISYEEAMELSHFGAKVIYPPTIQPLMNCNIPVLIRNTFTPNDEGTLLQSKTPQGGGFISGITSISQITLLSLEGSGMVGVAGFSKRLFEVLSREKINVIFITQASSEHSICVAVEEKRAAKAKEKLDEAFRYEMERQLIDPVSIESGLSIIALVGGQMKNHPGISGRMFAALGRNGINVRAIAQGSSERNISAVIRSADNRKALNVLHEEFFETTYKQLNLFIAGAGNVGGRLLAQLAGQQEYLMRQLHLQVRVIGLANSRQMKFAEEGINLSGWKEQLSEGEPMHGERFVQNIKERNLRNSVFVDVTASDSVAALYESILPASISVVACNKIAASSAYDHYQKLKSLSRDHQACFFFETNVGAGLPVIGTLNDLVRSGDSISRIEAVLSGTLNFVFNNYDGSRPFAEVVRQAQEEGYTEPDPRLDLGGTDVARKILILAREAGVKLEMEDIINNSFLPASCMQGSVADFYEELQRQEPHFQKIYESALSEKKKLKFVASYENGSASVGLRHIDPQHDFYHLYGKDNIVLFYTNRYPEQPLVVKGAGAGAEVTASGVFADIIRAARI